MHFYGSDPFLKVTAGHIKKETKMALPPLSLFIKDAKKYFGAPTSVVKLLKTGKFTLKFCASVVAKMCRDEPPKNVCSQKCLYTPLQCSGKQCSI